MVSTRQTSRSGRGRGRGGSHAVAVGLGPQGGVGECNQATSSRSSRRSRGSRGSPRGTESVPMVEPPQSTPVEDSSEEEYTPRTPTHEDYQEKIATLEEENNELSFELAKVQAEKFEVSEWLDDLQVEHAKLGEELNKVLTVNDELFEDNHTLAWKCKAIEWERRIVARSWKRRMGDRARYYRGAASEYLGLIRGYFSSWATQYRHGPGLGFLWNYRPDSSYEEFVRIVHYPMDMP